MCNKNAWVGDNIFVGDLSQFKILQKRFQKKLIHAGTMVQLTSTIVFTRRISFFRVLCSRHWIEDMLTHKLTYIFPKTYDVFIDRYFLRRMSLLFCHFLCHFLIMSFFTFLSDIFLFRIYRINLEFWLNRS